VQNIPYPDDMNGPMTINVRVNSTLGDFVAANVGSDGTYDNVSEYVRDLIRKDMIKAEVERIDRLKAELHAAFATPDSDFTTLNAESIIARNSRD
jgi:antitoxin ParD1/3/4